MVTKRPALPEPLEPISSDGVKKRRISSESIDEILAL